MDSPDSRRPGSNLESVSIRRATQRDEASLRQVQRNALAAANIIEPAARDWRGLIDSGRHFVYLAEDTRPFGFICAGAPLEEDVPGGGAGEIVGLYLEPAYQGHGMGRKLLVRGLSVLKRRTFERAFIWVQPSASRALATIRSLDFEPTAFERTTNLDGREVVETGYQLDLGGYF